VRGWQLSPASKKLDIVVVAARYDAEGNLHMAQGYERRGDVWSDLRLFDRGTLVERLHSQRRVAVGAVSPVPGDFDVAGHVRLQRKNGQARLTTGSAPADQDQLSVPLF